MLADGRAAGRTGCGCYGDLSAVHCCSVLLSCSPLLWSGESHRLNGLRRAGAPVGRAFARSGPGSRFSRLRCGLQGLSYNWIDSLLTRAPEALPSEVLRDRQGEELRVLTASSEKLRAFIEEQRENPEAWFSYFDPFVRVSSPPPAGETAGH